MKRVILMLIILTTSIVLYANDSIINDTISNIADLPVVTKPTNNNIISWSYWIIMTIGITIMSLLPKIKPIYDLLNKSNNTLIQRWISDASEFMSKIHYGSLIISGIIVTVILPLVGNDYIGEYIRNFNLLLVGIASVTLFAIKSK